MYILLFRIGSTYKASDVQVKIRKETKNKMSKIKGQTRVRRREDNFLAGEGGRGGGNTYGWEGAKRRGEG